MAWIESHQTLREHPKLYQLSDLLKVDRPQAVGHLHFLWWWCIDYAPFGDLGGFSNTQIAGAAGWKGDANRFVKAMIESRFLDEKPLRIHDWMDFCGKLMSQRIERSRLKKSRLRLKKSQKVPLESLPTVPTVPTVPNTPLTPQGGKVVDNSFEKFWNEYPKKVGKGGAEKVWKQIKPGPELFKRMLETLSWQTKSTQWRKDGGQFIPLPATWLRQRRWEDEPEPKRTGPADQDSRPDWMKQAQLAGTTAKDAEHSS